jgi:hypothetical protein
VFSSVSNTVDFKLKLTLLPASPPSVHEAITPTQLDVTQALVQIVTLPSLEICHIFFKQSQSSFFSFIERGE